MQTIKFKSFSTDASVDLKMSASFYNSVITALLNHSTMTIKELAQSLKELNTRSPKNNDELITLILLELAVGFEDAANKQGITKEDSVDVHTISSQEDDHES